MSTTTTPIHRPGCYDRPPFKATLIVQTGWHYFRDGFGQPHRTPVLAEIPAVNSQECQFTIRNPDHPPCAGCCRQKPTGE